MALVARERTGIAQKVDCNLLNAGAVLREDDFLRYDGKVSPPIADGGQYGLNALHRLFETERGWIYLIAERQGEWESLCGVIERRDLLVDARFTTAEARTKHDDDLWELLTETFADGTAASWIQRLRGAGVRCAEVKEQYNVGYFEDKQVIDSEMVVEHEHATYGKMHYCANCIVFGETRAIKSRQTPLLGEHNREKLSSLGYAPTEIDELYEKGVLTTEDPPEA